MNPHQSKHLHHVLFKTLKAHRTICHEQFTKLDLTVGQPKILDFLCEHNGCSQKELAKHCHIEPATATSLLGHLERNGLIYRQANDRDRRVLNVYLTDEGKNRQHMVQKVFEQIDEDSFKGFTEEEKAKTVEYLNRICQNLKGRGSQHDE